MSAPQLQGPLPLFGLLQHENEASRPTATGQLICARLPQTRIFTWQRTAPDPELLALLTDEQLQPYLIFPADRPATEHRATDRVKPGCRPLFLIPDGTWKEARKMVRKSPYLDNLPILSLEPQQPTRYRLRRNPDRLHLCTSEIAALLLSDYSPQLAQQLTSDLDEFQQQYQSLRQNQT